jgi:hypothetical protein
MSDRVSVRRFFIALLLAIGVLGAQFALVEHSIEHAFHNHDEACVECLALPGMQAVPPQAVGWAMATPVAEVLERAVPPVPTFALQLAFRSRAPPALHD